MSDIPAPGSSAGSSQPLDSKGPPLFQAPSPREGGSLNGKVLAIAAAVIVVLAAIGVLATRHSTPTVNPHVLAAADPYAASLPVSGIEMSEAGNGAGEKAIYIDGKISNSGTQTVSGVTVQAVFQIEGGQTQVETLPLALIRTREPYVDLQPVASAPLRPEEAREFRLIFEKVPDGWNVQAPEIRIVRVSFQ
jgi:Protein of unknown function (DUF2393)